MKCFICGKDTKNPKFCSRKCSTINSNRVSPKNPRKQRFCKNCGEEVFESRKMFCQNCNPKNVDWSKITLGDLKRKFSGRPQHRFSRIRVLTNTYYKSSGICRICGYSKHAELHHIKKISSFSDDTPISVIIDPSNVIELCPNCHWEADEGKLVF